MIKPSVGRIVLYRERDTTLPAIVVKVINDHEIIADVFHYTAPYVVPAQLPLLQDDDKPTGHSWFEWMDYQKGQAAKTETVTEELHKRITQLEELVTNLRNAGVGK